MKIRFFAKMFVTLVCLTVFGSNRATAQTNGTWTGTASANWSATASWLGGTIADSGGIATFNDLSGLTGGITVTLDTTRTLSQLNYNSGYSYTVATAAGQFLNMSATGLTLNAQLSLTTSPSSFFTTANTISANISGTGDLIKTGTGSVALTGTGSTFTGTVRINQGTLWVNSGNTATLGNAANGIDINGGTFGVNTTALTINRNVNIGSSGGAIQTFVALTIGTTGSLTGTGTLVKQIGNANMTISGTATGFTGALRVEGATVTLDNNAQLGASATNAISLPGGTITASNTTTNLNNRFNGRAVNSAGGNVTLLGNATAASTEVVGDLSLTQGNTFITVTPNAAQSSELTFNNLLRSNGASVFFSGTSFGSTPGAGVGTINLTTLNPAFLVGTNSDALSTAIIPFAYGNTVSGTTAGSSFVTRDTITGRLSLVPLATGFATDITTAASTNNVDQAVSATLAAPTTINALRTSPTGAITISGSALTITSGAILYNNATAANSTTISAPVTAGVNELVLSANTGATTATPGGLIVSGVISGTGGLSLTGGGVISITNTGNTYTGETNITRGTFLVPGGTITNDGTPSLFGQSTNSLKLWSGGGISRLWSTGALIINRGIDVGLGGSSTTGLGTAGLSASESVTVNGNVSLNNPTGSTISNFLFLEGGDTQAEAVTFNGTVSGVGGLRANFGSYVILNGNNSYSGSTLVGTSSFQTGTGIAAQQTGETWEAGNNNAFGTGTVWIHAQAPSTQPITGVPTIIAGGAPRTISNNIVIQNGLANFGGTNAITFSGTFNLNGSAAGNTFLGVNTGSNVIVSGEVGHGGLVKGGGGTLTFSGTNIYSGQTIIRQGTLSVGSIGNGGVAGNLGQGLASSTYLMLSGNDVGQTGTLRYTGPGESTNRLMQISGTGGTIDSSGSGAINFTNTGAFAMPAPVGSGTGISVALIAGAGVAAVSTINAAQLVVGSTVANANFTGGTTTITEVGPNHIRFGAVSTNAASSTQTLVITLPVAVTSRVLTLTGTNTANNTIASVLQNAAAINLSVVKSGIGTWNLTGANTYSAGTTVNAGTLLINNTTGSGTGTGAVTVNNTGSTIGGAGTISGALTVNANANVAPGNSSGTLTVSGATIVAGNYQFELSTAGTSGAVLNSGTSSPTLPHTNHDVLVVNNTLNLTGATIPITSLGTTGMNNAQSYSWLIATSTGLTGTPTLGTISGTDFLAAAASGGTFSLGVSGNNVILNFVPVPEPATVLAISAAVLGLGGMIRRRVKKAGNVTLAV